MFHKCAENPVVNRCVSDKVFVNTNFSFTQCFPLFPFLNRTLLNALCNAVLKYLTVI